MRMLSSLGGVFGGNSESDDNSSETASEPVVKRSGQPLTPEHFKMHRERCAQGQPWAGPEKVIDENSPGA